MFRQNIIIFMPAKIQKYKCSSQSYSFLKKYYFHVFYRAQVYFSWRHQSKRQEIKWKLWTSQGAETDHLVVRKLKNSGSILGKGRKFLPFAEGSDRLQNPTVLPFEWHRGPLTLGKSLGANLTTHFDLEQRLRMNGGVLPHRHVLSYTTQGQRYPDLYIETAAKGLTL